MDQPVKGGAYLQLILLVVLSSPTLKDPFTTSLPTGEEPKERREESGVPGPNSPPTNRDQSIKAILKSVCGSGVHCQPFLTLLSPFAVSTLHHLSL